MTKNRKIMWRADTAEWRAIQVQCPDGLHPHEDIDGHKIFSNTHFDTPEKAWDHLNAESMAWLSMSSMHVENAEKELLKVKDKFISAGRAVALVHERLRLAVKKDEIESK